MKRLALRLTLAALLCTAACAGDPGDEMTADPDDTVELDPLPPIEGPPTGTCGTRALVYSPSANLTGYCCTVNGSAGTYQPLSIGPGWYRCTF